MMAIEPHYVECVAKKEKKTRICDTCGKEVDAWGYNRKVVDSGAPDVFYRTVLPDGNQSEFCVG